MEKQKLIEKYKDIPDDEFVPLECVPKELLNKYEINKLGHIKTISTGKIRTKYSVDECGYPRVHLGSKETYIRARVHILLAKTFISNPENKPIVDHINHDRSCLDLSGLRFVTVSENNFNKSGHGRREIIYIKYNNAGEELERVLGSSLTPRERDNLNHGIKDFGKYKGFVWKRIDPIIEDYKSAYGEPKDEEWLPCLRFPDQIECNKNGMLRRNKHELTVGSINDFGYRVIKIKNHQYFIHRLVYETFSRELLESSDIIDHCSTDRGDNRFENLRKCDNQSENMLNPITRIKNSKGSVSLYSLRGEFIKSFKSLRIASEELGEKDYMIRRRIDEEKVFEKYGIFIYDKNPESLNNILKKVIFKYDKLGNLIKCYPQIKLASEDSKSCSDTISKYIDTGKLAPDGHYYYHGPHEFTDDEQNKNQDSDNNI